MTEAEWLWAATPVDVLTNLPTATSRKRRLYCVACCWRVVTLNHAPFIREALAIAERYADGWERRSLMVSARQQIGATADFRPWGYHPSAVVCVANAVGAVCAPGTLFHPPSVFDWIAGIYDQQSSEAEEVIAFQRELLSEIFGNPFRPITFLPEWRTETAVTLARTMYEAREFSAMPILADALQDAGCDNEDILSHCQAECPHVRGCWVVDLVLEKS